MIRFIINIYKYFLCSIFVLVFLSSHSYSQDDVDVNNENAASNNSVKNSFPIVVIDMQYIVARSAAAVEVRNELDRLKKEYTAIVTKEEEELKLLQDELGVQRSILPVDEFNKLEQDFRSRVEKLQAVIAEKNKELEQILKKSINIIQRKSIQIITNIARERGLAAVLDTSTVVLAADSINISKIVIENLNKEMPSIDIDELKKSGKDEPGE
ncbi:MAG: hypothetical protein CFH32_01343 [Alphaproteobacteria bacterium MarineAlpha9_Bin2]|nr:MAG: hypothetical protein CFH32_01343 [Alphaproteobacteria bacterium MarineAlpha9_Bin2]